MTCRLLPYVIVTSLVVSLAGCSNYERPRRPAWRTQAENACLAQGLVRASAFVQPAAEIEGPGICGLTRPFKVSALQDGTIGLNATSTLDCPMIAALDSWITAVVQPAARTRFGTNVAAIHSMGAYSCRAMNNQPGARLSEHAFGNAIDIGGFRLADGRELSIVRDWTRGDEETRAFFQEIHAGACDHFTTVLGPGSNVFHYNHLHLDLAMHGNTSRGPRRICKPAPQQSPLPQVPRDDLPDPPEIEDDIEIAQAGRPPSRPATVEAGPGPAPVAALPPAVVMPVPRPKSLTSFAPIPPAPIGASAPRFARSVPEGKPADWDLPSSLAQR